MSSEYESELEPVDLCHDLQQWACSEPNLPRVAVSNLLKILNKHLPNHSIPLDVRTLLKTGDLPQTTITSVTSGFFAYLGLHQAIVRCVKSSNIDLENIDCLNILFNIDGVPIYKSTNSQFWPILVSLKNIHCVPAEVAIFTLQIHHINHQKKERNKSLKISIIHQHHQN